MLPDGFKIDINGFVILEETKNGQIIANQEEVASRIADKENQTGKWAEYIKQWEAEGLI